MGRFQGAAMAVVLATWAAVVASDAWRLSC